MTFPSNDLLTTINRHFAPFCHGTEPALVDEIEENGLKPRGETGYSQWEESGMESHPDRVYFASVRDGIGSCIEAIQQACQFSSANPLLEGIIYFLEEIPKEYEDFLTYDEDLIQIRGVDRDKATPLRSLREMGTIAIEHRVEPKYLKKFHFKDFFYYVKKNGWAFHGFEDWNHFVTDFYIETYEDGDVEWFKENLPEIFEEPKSKKNTEEPNVENHISLDQFKIKNILPLKGYNLFSKTFLIEKDSEKNNDD